MNVFFWMLFALGLIGLIRTPKRNKLLFRAGIAGLSIALVCALILHFT
jgi:hypothetical protein